MSALGQWPSHSSLRHKHLGCLAQGWERGVIVDGDLRAATATAPATALTAATSAVWAVTTALAASAALATATAAAEGAVAAAATAAATSAAHGLAAVGDTEAGLQGLDLHIHTEGQMDSW